MWDGAPPSQERIAAARFLAVLGSASSVNDAESRWVAMVVDTVRNAIRSGVPVLGICFGSQALSVALGGKVSRMGVPEISWREVSTSGTIVPPGPWIVWHYEAFTVPRGAETLAWSEFGPLAFRYGRHLGVQFHAEATAAGSEVWIEEEIEDLRHWEVDAEELRDEGRKLEPRAAGATTALLEAWWSECVEEGAQS